MWYLLHFSINVLITCKSSSLVLKLDPACLTGWIEVKLSGVPLVMTRKFSRDDVSLPVGRRGPKFFKIAWKVIKSAVSVNMAAEVAESR